MLLAALARPDEASDFETVMMAATKSEQTRPIIGPNTESINEPIEAGGDAGPQAVQPITQKTARRIELGCLLGDAREAIIVHNGEDYRLRITSRGRLILTK